MKISNHFQWAYGLCAVLLTLSISAKADDDNQNRSLTENLPEKSSIIVPDTTCLFAIRPDINAIEPKSVPDKMDSLYMDIYYPQEGSETHIDGIQKPTLLYIFGGGFVNGEKDAILQLRYYKKLTELGFSVIAIDYRLGMKSLLHDKVSPLKMGKGLPRSLQLGVEDLYAATTYLLENGRRLNINPDNLVISGSSAGAMIVLQADYQMCNRTRFDVPLPQGFRYKGIMSFSGGVMSREGRPDYRDAQPAPTLLMHGIEDRIVNYKKIQFFNHGFFGSSTLAKRLAKYNANYQIMRYQDSGHEVAGSLRCTLPQQLNFIYENVMKGDHKVIDATLQDPHIDHRFNMRSFRDIKSFSRLHPDAF